MTDVILVSFAVFEFSCPSASFRIICAPGLELVDQVSYAVSLVVLRLPLHIPQNEVAGDTPQPSRPNCGALAADNVVPWAN